MKTTVVVLALSATIGWAGELPTWEMAKLDGLNETQWTPAATEGGVSYRAARAGRQAAWTVPAWWGKTFRPAKGTRYVLEVRYKDTVKSPAVFYSHAGLVRNWGHSRLHRFGGAADGKWKTVSVPVSWDLLCRAPGKETTAFSIAAKGADLPVSRVAVRMAKPGDAERFRHETRAWVARANARRFPKLDAGPKAEPVLPAGMKGAPLVPYLRPYTMEILPSSAPRAGDIRTPLKVRMTRDEYEPAVFGVYANGSDLQGVTFSLSELDGPAGKLDCDAELLTVEYSPYQYQRRGQVSPARIVPMRLWPAYPVDIPAGRSHWFWITLKTDPARSKPGTYRGTISIRSIGKGRAIESRRQGGARARVGHLGAGPGAVVPIEVEVLPVTLMTAKAIDVPVGGCLLSLPPEQEMVTYAQHNQCSVHLFGSEIVGLENVNGELKLGLEMLDDWMAVATANGVTHAMWFYGNPNSYPDTLHLERRLYRSSAKTPRQSRARRQEFIDKHRKFKANPKAAAVLPEVRPLYTQWVRKLAAHAKAKRWPKLLLHPFDEPAKWDRLSGAGGRLNVLGTGPWLEYHFRDACALIRKASKDVLVAGDLHHAKTGLVFLRDVDVYCTNAIHEDLKLGDKVRAAGGIFWQYRGCNATQTPFSPRDTYGFFFGAFDSRGGLIWAMNWGPGFDYNEGTGWMYSWYTPFGTIVSPAYEGVREGVDDRRLIETVRKRMAKDPKAMALLNGILKQAVARRVKRGKDLCFDLAKDPAAIRKLDEWRSQLLDLLARK